MSNKNKYNVCVIGLGYIGFPTALVVSNANHIVVGVDNNKKLIKDLENNKVHIEEDEIQNLNLKVRKKNKIKFSNYPIKSDIFIICVPTPLKKNKADLSYVNKAVESLFPVLQNDNTIIIESTCPVGTTTSIKMKIDNFYNNKLNYKLAYSPERVLPGNILYEILNNDKIVGGIDDNSTNFVKNFFSKIIKGNVHAASSNMAELCKLVENSFRDLNIAFANELSILCSNNKMRVDDLINLANKHKRVNILNPSIGVGGHCIPIDPLFLLELDKKNTSLIKLSRSINKKKTQWILNKLSKELKKINKNKIKIICMGLSYKPDVGDMRESPSLEIYQALTKNKKFLTYAHDPHIKDKKLFIKNNLKDIKDFDVYIKLVEHKIFDKKPYKNLFKKNKLIDLTKS